ncbi:MAG: hypothetical protein OHK0021_23360 [Bryobacter sp.]
MLDGLEEIPVCVGYKVNGVEVHDMPATNEELSHIEPVYEMLPGWAGSTKGATSIEAMPAEARRYLDFLAERTGIEVGCVSNGPERNETIVVEGSRLAGLLG